MSSDFSYICPLLFYIRTLLFYFYTVPFNHISCFLHISHQSADFILNILIRFDVLYTYSNIYCLCFFFSFLCILHYTCIYICRKNRLLFPHFSTACLGLPLSLSNHFHALVSHRRKIYHTNFLSRLSSHVHTLNFFSRGFFHSYNKLCMFIYGFLFCPGNKMSGLPEGPVKHPVQLVSILSRAQSRECIMAAVYTLHFFVVCLELLNAICLGCRHSIACLFSLVYESVGRFCNLAPLLS